jgi:hypothetical protein
MSAVLRVGSLSFEQHSVASQTHRSRRKSAQSVADDSILLEQVLSLTPIDLTPDVEIGDSMPA